MKIFDRHTPRSDVELRALLHKALLEQAAMQMRISTASALHSPVGEDGRRQFCDTCGGYWPCHTLKILEGM